jgi:hypothetical protein
VKCKVLSVKTSLLYALGAAALASPVGAEPLRVPLLWPKGIYLGVQTYDGHSEIGMQGAVDFFLTHDRPDAFNRDMLGRRENTPLLAPFDGDLYAFIDEREPGYQGEFAPIDPQRVSAGWDSLPVGSFSFPDGSTGRNRQFTQTIVVHDGEIGFRMIHSTWNITLFSPEDRRRLREAIGTLATTRSPAPTVLRKLERRVLRGETVGFLYGWDGAKTHPHVHLNIFRNPGYSESNLGWGTFLDLTDPEQVLMGGQVILDRRFEISRRETWLTGLVYQYPAMPRTEFKPGLPVIVDVAWTGQNTTVPRTSSRGPDAEPLQAGTRLTVTSGDPEVADWSVWIPVTDAAGVSLRVRAEHLRPEVPAGTEPASNNHSTDIAPHGSSPIAR